MPSWKGKERQVESNTWVYAREDEVEGTGGTGGIVLPLDQVGSGIYDVAYTLPMKFGDTQQFSLQVDTGSSDLWIASKSCSTSSCALTNGRLYDPSNARETGQDFTIPYLQGSASGPIVWEKVTLGGYTIDNQALAAANDVQREPLAPDFSGILGLALPLNSIIAQSIPPVTSNAPDGAAWASNLFSITPLADAPAARFLSLSLARPGSLTVPSLLGIGRHPAALVPDPGKVQYDSLVSERTGTLFWKASVRAITVYVGGEAKPVALGRSAMGGPWPSAVLDSGVPLILTTTGVANAIYGAVGVTPADDGTYYVPCTTPLNLSITLDGRPETPIHPLDLTAEPLDDNKAQFCIGLIQPADGFLGVNGAGIGDMILGVPFLRNVYTVMAYTPPNDDGSFPSLASSSTSTTTSSSSSSTSTSTSTSSSSNDDDDDDTPPSRVSTKVTPVLGILPLTDPSTALAEFTTVRILNQPLSTAPPNTHTGSDQNTKTVSVGGKKLSVGIVVLIGLVSFFAVCCILFLGRWLLFRRRFRKGGGGGKGEEWDGGVDLDAKTAYRLARRGSLGALGAVPLVGVGKEGLGEDGVKVGYRGRREAGKGLSESTVGSDRTLAVEAGEFGYAKSHSRSRSRGDDDEDDEDREEEDDWDPRVRASDLGWGHDTTLVSGRKTPKDVPQDAGLSPITSADHSEQRQLLFAGGGGEGSPPSSPDQASFFPHARTYSDVESGLGVEVPPVAHRGGHHAGTPSVSMPLLGGLDASGVSGGGGGGGSPPERQRTQSTFAETEEAIVTHHSRLFSVDSLTSMSLSHPAPVRLLSPSEPARQDSGTLAPSPSAAPSRQHTQSSIAETEEAIVSNHARLFSVDSPSPTSASIPVVPVRLVPPSEPARQDSNVVDFGAFGLPLPRPERGVEEEEEDELGPRTSMAGIGSGRFGRLGFGGMRPSIDSLPFNRESLMSVSSAGTLVAPSSAFVVTERTERRSGSGSGEEGRS